MNGEGPAGAAARGADGQVAAAPGMVGCEGGAVQGEAPGLAAAGCEGVDGQGEEAAGAAGLASGHGEGCCALARPAGASSTAASERAHALIIGNLPEPVVKDRPFDKRPGRR